MKIIKPHNKIAKEITKSEYRKVFSDAQEMVKLCYSRCGMYNGGYAVAHPQISEKPLRFFVTKEGEIIMNPRIIRHSNYEKEKIEGCLSFPNQLPIMTKRWQKCEVKYELLNPDWSIQEIVESCTGERAQIMQHEIEHLDGKYIYPLENDKNNP